VAEKFVDKWNLNAELIIFQNHLNKQIDSFKTIYSKDLNVEANYYSPQNLNRYRQCPSCGIIWFKVYGCNSMKCGNRTKGKDVTTNCYFDYVIEFLSGKMFWKKKKIMEIN